MRLAIEQINLKMAQDEVRPRLDMVLGYHQNSRRFDNETDRALKDSLRSHHPGWSVGLEFSTPLGGNTPAKARREMAQIKIHQNQLQLDTVRADLTNQLWLRLEQLKQTYQEMGRYEAHVGYLQELLRVQQERYELGASSFAELIERQDRLNAGLVRLLDVKIRYELARAAVQLTDGSLLDSLGVDIDVEFL
jgi:outer membrane protein TolC